jgi:DNA-binding NarL/FixJ family response regulator
VAAVRIALCDDSSLFRSGLAALLSDLGLEVVAQVDSRPDLLTAVTELAPDVAVVDLRLPPTFSDEGLLAALEIHDGPAHTPVLVLSTYVETSYAMRLISGGRSGVGYLLKDRVTDASSLLDALTRLVAGEVVLDHELVSRLLERSRAITSLDSLTLRESEVLALLAEGRTNAGIAAALVLSAKTVETHVASIFAKLDLHDDPDSNRRVRAVLTFLRASGTAS